MLFHGVGGQQQFSARGALTRDFGLLVWVLALASSGCGSSIGTFEHRFPHGELRFRVETKNGKYHGASTTWHSNGQVASKGTYRRGQRHGVFEYFDVVGDLQRRAVFFSDREIWSSKADEPVPVAIAQRLRKVEEKRAEHITRRLRTPPGFVTADRVQGREHFEARTDFVFPRDMAGARNTGQRLSTGGGWFRRKLGVYGRLTMSHRGIPGSQFRHGKGILDAGGLYRIARGDSLFLLRAGALVPLIGDDAEGFATERSNSFAMVRDSAYSLPSVVGTRLSASWIRPKGPLYARLDGGLDAVRSIASGDQFPRIKGGAVISRANLALGFVTGDVTTATELAFATGSQGTLDPISTAALSVHLPWGEAQPFVSLITPITGETVGGLALSVGFLWQEEVSNAE